MYLSPIRFLIEDVKDIFRVNSPAFFDAVQKNIVDENENIKITIISKPLIGIGEVGARWHERTLHVDINECLLCAIWAASYFVANAYVSLYDYLNGSKKELPIESDSFELINYAKSLVPSFEEWPENLPIPQDFNCNPYAKLANMIMPIATDVILCHELAHMNLHHTKDGGIQQEIEAYNLAIGWVLKLEKEEYPVNELAVMAAFVTMILIVANALAYGERHPSSFDRLSKYLERLRIRENDILWFLAILVYRAWEEQFSQGNMTFNCDNNISGMDLYKSITGTTTQK